MKNRSVKASLRKSATADTSEIKSDEEAKVIAAIRGLHKVFSTVLQLNEMTSPRPMKNVAPENLTSEEKYIVWLQDTYRDTISRLLQLLYHESNNIQELCLCSLMKLVAEEGAHPIIKPNPDQSTFPDTLYKKILTNLLSTSHVTVELIARAQEFMEYDDVRVASMNHVMEVMKQKSGQLPEVQLKNIFQLLQILSMPDDKPDRSPSCLVTSSKVKELKYQKRLYGNVWIEFLKNKLSVSQYKRILVMLHDKIMPHMANPVSLCDFLTHAYNIGGAISLLALNGIFVLIQKHHLNYPDFYTKLYALLDENVLHVKYRARFFYLTDLFLTSTHLPVYLVAAFIKRLSRLSLSAPTDSLLFVIPLIYNLFIRHPHSQTLIHAKQPTEMDNDPYCYEETDPAKCNAMDSSLWELKTLQMHYHPDVANMARKMNKNMPDREYDLSERLDSKYDLLMADELEKPMEKVHTAFTPVNGLFSSKDDQCAQFWAME